LDINLHNQGKVFCFCFCAKTAKKPECFKSGCVVLNILNTVPKVAFSGNVRQLSQIPKFEDQTKQILETEKRISNACSCFTKHYYFSSLFLWDSVVCNIFRIIFMILFTIALVNHIQVL